MTETKAVVKKNARKKTAKSKSAKKTVKKVAKKVEGKDVKKENSKRVSKKNAKKTKSPSVNKTGNNRFEIPGFGEGKPGFPEGWEPTTAEEINRVAEFLMGVRFPSKAICPHHDSPLEYLVASFIRQEDLLVWANRGGGKTMLAAAATLFDGLFRGPMKFVYSAEVLISQIGWRNIYVNL